MPDPFAPVSPGDDLSVSAVAWNAALAAGLAHRQPPRPDQPATRRTVNGRVEQLALNSTGADLAFGKPAAVTAAGGYDLGDDAQALNWLRNGLLTLGEPAAATAWVCVTAQPIPAGKVGWVAVSGVVLCDVDSAAGATWAAPQAGDTAALLGGPTGTVRVLHVPATGGSQRRCLVYLHERPGPGEACGNLPLMHKVVVGVDFVTPKVKYRIRSVDVGGCETLGDTVCEDGATCTTGEELKYWCIDGVCWKVYDGITPPDGTGPYDTPEECAEACVDAWYCDAGTCVFVAAGDDPPGGATGPYTTEAGCTVACVGGEPDCCPETILALTATLSGGHGTMSLPWDGAYWKGSKALSCGETLHLRYTQACSALGYSCDGVTWLPCPASLGSILCSPLTDSRVYTCDMNDTLGGCVAGSCGSITVTVAS